MLLGTCVGDVPKAGSSRHLYLVRLEDRAIREIKGIDPQKILFGDLGASYHPIIEWNADQLLIGTSDGILTYRFDFDEP